MLQPFWGRGSRLGSFSLSWALPGSSGLSCVSLLSCALLASSSFHALPWVAVHSSLPLLASLEAYWILLRALGFFLCSPGFFLGSLGFFCAVLCSLSSPVFSCARCLGSSGMSCGLLGSRVLTCISSPVVPFALLSLLACSWFELGAFWRLLCRQPPLICK